jgi:hypothetical protein
VPPEVPRHHADDVCAADDADQPALIDDRDGVDPGLEHHLGQVLHLGVWSDAEHVLRHDLVSPRTQHVRQLSPIVRGCLEGYSPIEQLEEGRRREPGVAHDEVELGHEAHQAAAVQHRDPRHASLQHQLREAVHRRVWRRGVNVGRHDVSDSHLAGPGRWATRASVGELARRPTSPATPPMTS